MNSDTHSDRVWFEDLFFVLSGRPYTLRRSDVLRKACEVLRAERVAALLWLWDPDWHVLALNAYSSNITDEPIPEQLLGLLAKPRSDIKGKDCPSDPRAWTLSRDLQPRLNAWAAEHGVNYDEKILAVQSRIHDEHRTIAFLQLLSSDNIEEQAVLNAKVLCGGIAVLLSRSRDDRQLQAVDQLVRKQEDRTAEEWLEIALDALLEITNATAGIVFRETNRGFQAIVAKGVKKKSRARLTASPKSVVTRVAQEQKPVRLLNFADDDERFRAFNSFEHDLALHEVMERELLPENDKIRSVLLAPVVFQNHTLAVIALVNKNPLVHLARVFSKTDEEVLNTVSGFLTGILPSIELYDAVGRMAKVISPRVLAEPDEMRKGFSLLAELIPGTTGLGLIRHPKGDAMYAVERLGGDLWTNNASILLRHPDKILPASDDPLNPHGRYYMTQQIPTPNDPCWLVVEFSRPHISGYEHQILSFFSKELSHNIVSEQDRETVNETFAQLRHAIRSGLTGVVGYVHEALGCFEIYRRLEYAPSELSRARFRKALQRANFAAAKTQYLLEETRFLLGNITHASLRLEIHSVTSTLKSVLDTLRPYAEERGLEMRLTNVLQGDADRAEFDKLLMEMLLFNVIDNAIKYSDCTDSTIGITVDAPKNNWRVEVSDHGNFIRPEHLDMIFMPFTRRLPTDATDQAPGTGLGLAVARQIARAHSGDVECNSVQLDDTTAETVFTVTIPRNVRKRA